MSEGNKSHVAFWQIRQADGTKRALSAIQFVEAIANKVILPGVEVRHCRSVDDDPGWVLVTESMLQNLPAFLAQQETKWENWCQPLMRYVFSLHKIDPKKRTFTVEEMRNQLLAGTVDSSWTIETEDGQQWTTLRELLSGKPAWRQVRKPISLGKGVGVLARYSLGARILSRPIWIPTIRGAAIGMSIGLIFWFCMGSLLVIKAKAGGYSMGALLVYLFCLTHFLHWFSVLVLPENCHRITGKIADKAFLVVIIAIVGTAMNERSMPPAAKLQSSGSEFRILFSGVTSGIPMAIGSFVAGSFAGALPGMIIGTLVGLFRRLEVGTTASTKEPLTLVILFGLILPILLLVCMVVLYPWYSAVIEIFIEKPAQ